MSNRCRSFVIAAVVTLATGSLVGASTPTSSGASPRRPVAAPSVVVPPTLHAELDRRFDAFDANQGVAVDAYYFYAVNNRTITKHRRSTGRPLLQFVSPEDGPIIHMDSGTVVGDRLYIAASNYDQAPETSAVEVFDTRTMRHIDTFSFGIERGSLTWLDRHEGAWWGGFANYDEVPDGASEPYGETVNTQVVKMNDRFHVEQSWVFPAQILDRFRPMSNSGGSWGPDGRLWLMGHDLDEAYVMTVPPAGSQLTWVATVILPSVEGQAIAWDRSGRHPTLWAIKRSTRQVLSFDAPYRAVTGPAGPGWRVVGPGHFQR